MNEIWLKTYTDIHVKCPLFSPDFFYLPGFFNSCRSLPETKRHSSPFLHWSGSKFLVVMAACTPSIHVFLGRPLSFLSRGNQSIINFGTVSSGILLTWPYHCSLFFFVMSMTSSFPFNPIISFICSFFILSTLDFLADLLSTSISVDTILTNPEFSQQILPDCWLEVSIRKVLRPATSSQVFLGFPVSISKCWDGSQDSKLPLHASHVALPT